MFNAAVVLSLFLIVLVEKYVSELEVPPLVPIKLGLSSSLSSLNGLVPAPPPVDTFGESSNAKRPPMVAVRSIGGGIELDVLKVKRWH